MTRVSLRKKTSPKCILSMESFHNQKSFRRLYWSFSISSLGKEWRGMSEPITCYKFGHLLLGSSISPLLFYLGTAKILHLTLCEFRNLHTMHLNTMLICELSIFRGDLGVHHWNAERFPDGNGWFYYLLFTCILGSVVMGNGKTRYIDTTSMFVKFIYGDFHLTGQVDEKHELCKVQVGVSYRTERANIVPTIFCRGLKNLET